MEVSCDNISTEQFYTSTVVIIGNGDTELFYTSTVPYSGGGQRMEITQLKVHNLYNSVVAHEIKSMSKEQKHNQGVGFSPRC
jgi:hypothetical protein